MRTATMYIENRRYVRSVVSVTLVYVSLWLAPKLFKNDPTVPAR